MELQDKVADRITATDEITKSFQSEAEALRKMVQDKDLIITALKAHCLSLNENFRQILLSIAERFPGSDVAEKSARMAETLKNMDVTKLGSLENR